MTIAGNPPMVVNCGSTCAFSDSHTPTPSTVTNARRVTFPLIPLRNEQTFDSPKGLSTYALGAWSRLSAARCSWLSTVHGSRPSSLTSCGLGSCDTVVVVVVVGSDGG